MIESAEVEHSILLAGCEIRNLDRPRRVLAVRAQRRGSAATPASRAPTASCSATTPRSASRDAAAVTGAGGMLGREVARRRRGARARLRRPHPRRARHHRRARRSRAAIARALARRRSSTARPGPTSTAPRPTRTRRSRSTATAPATLAGAASAARRAPDPRLDRLRLRRHRDAALRRVGSDRPDHRLRAHQARRRARGARRLAPARRRADRVAVRDRARELRHLRPRPGGRRARRSRRSPTSSAARPTPATSREKLLDLAARAARRHPPRGRLRPLLALRVRAGDPRARRARGRDRAGAARIASRRRGRPGACSPPSAIADPLPSWQDGLDAYLALRRARGVRLLVCGGAGFIGSNFVRLRAARAARTIVVLDKLTYAGRRENLHDVEADPRFRFHPRRDRGSAPRSRRRSTASTRSSTSPPRRTSTARSPSPTRSCAPTRSAPTCCSRRRASAASATCRSRPTRSTARSPRARSPSRSPLRPSSPYSATKAGADLLVASYHETFGLEALICRGSNNYGPYQYPEKLIPLMVLNALAGDRLPVYGDGLNVRNWLFVEDFARGDRHTSSTTAAPARSTTSAAPTSAPTSRSCGASSSCAGATSR